MKSQFDEESVILKHVRHPGTFLEIGAYDGIFLSNTYCLLERGWHGVYVEPSPNSFLQLKNNLKNFKNNITLINCAIGKENNIIEFYNCIEDNSGIRSISSTAKSHVQMWNRKNANVKFEKFYVASITIQTLLDHIGYDFQFINIDVESNNEMVLQDFPIDKMKNTKLICIEKDSTGDRYDHYLKEFNMIHETQPNLIYYRE